MAFATSAVRDATNSAQVLRRVCEETGVELRVLSGEDEARMTFLAVRRWFGWSAGRLLVLDIGGGSLEIAAGIDEEPDGGGVAAAGRGPADPERLRPTRRAGRVAALSPTWTSSSTHRELDELRTGRSPRRPRRRSARWPGWPAPRPAATGCGRRARSPGRACTRCAASSSGSRRRGWPNWTESAPSRAHQLLAGAVVAEAAMRRLGVDELRICPWALREGVILRAWTQSLGRGGRG